MLTAAESTPSIIPTGNTFEIVTDVELCVREVSASLNALLKAKPKALLGRSIGTLFQSPQLYPERISSTTANEQYFTLGLKLPGSNPVVSLWKMASVNGDDGRRYLRWVCCFMTQAQVSLTDQQDIYPLPAPYSNGTLNAGHHNFLESSSSFNAAISAAFTPSTFIFFVIDQRGSIAYASPGLGEILGFCPQAALGARIFDYVELADVSKLEPLIDNPKKLDAHSIANVRLINKKKDWLWMDLSIKKDAPDEIFLLFHRLPDRTVSQPIVREFSKTINDIVNSITDGFVAVDESMTVRLWNHVAEKVTGVTRHDVGGKKLEDRFPTITALSFYRYFKIAMEQKVTINREEYVTPLDLWFDLTLYPHENGLFIYFKDITVRKNQEMLLAVEKNVLEINAKPNASLKDTIDILLEEIHNLYINTFCSVTLFQEKDQTIRHLSGNWMSRSFIELFNGKKCEPELGPHARAIAERKPVVDNDPRANPIEDFSGTPVPQVVSSWSFPIINVRDEVLGCFSCYHTKWLEATEKQLGLFERIADFICIIIENRRAEELIRLSNDRYLLATRVTSQAVWDWDVTGSKIFLGEGFSRTFEYDPSENIIPFDTWKQRIHHSDRDKVIKSLYEFIDKKDTALWSCEYRFKKAGGDYSIVVNKGSITFDSNGDANRMIGSIEDVTEKKNLEKKLIKEEIEKQRLIAQAVVDAQESERAKIGKELHDNVNQVLSTAKLFLEVAKTNAHDRVDLIGKSAVQIHHAINEIRHISQSLVPPSISDIGLSESIKDLVQNIAVSKTLKVEYNNIGDIEKNISENQKVMIFRIIQEQVNNVLKHAEATRISIQLKVDNKEIELVIADNGKGFDQEKIRTKKGVGLTNIASRVDLFNGKVDIISAPGKGCQLIVKILRNLK